MNGHASINKAFRLVWNEARGAYVMVPESARGKGKSRRSAAAGGLLFATALTLPLWGMPGSSLAQQQPVGSGTSAYISANGVPVVNIAAPNSAGLSHNQYSRYDVQSNGLVLNNSAAAVQSQLAGVIAGNTNLGVPAQVILNEVVSNNRSQLAGFTEVAGSKAAVIVANPYGITCNGCGFYNTDRVTLTTGLPTFANGLLTGFSVGGGDVLVGGNGLDATAQQLLDIVTRSVKIEGAVKTAASGVLGITTGPNVWNYDTRTVTGGATASGTVPSYAIDSSALGGMYAGQIRLIATEQGVGVRMLGEAAASASDFTLSAAGKVELNAATISAERDLSLASTSTATDALALADASLSAKRNLSLTAAGGGASIQGGALVAGGNLTGTLDRLVDSASASTTTDHNTRYGNNVSLTVAQAAAINGTSWGAAQALTVSAASLNSATSAARFFAGSSLGLAATTGDLLLGASKVRAVDDLSLSSASGQIGVAAGGGAQSTQGDIVLVAGNGISNAGTITADAGALDVELDGSFNNSGTLNAGTTLSLERKTAGTATSFTNTTTGQLFSGGSLSVNLTELDNSGVVQAAGTTSLTLERLNNQANAKLLAGTTRGAGATFTLTGGGRTLSNLGLIQTAGALTATAASITNSGSLLTLRDADGGASGGLSLTADTVMTNTGVIDSGGTLSVHATATTGTGDSLTNSGTMQSAGDMTLSVGRQMTNAYEGKVLSGAKLTLTSGAAEFNAINNGVLRSQEDMRIGQNQGSDVHLVNFTMQAPTTVQTAGHRVISNGTLTMAAKKIVSNGTWKGPGNNDYIMPRLQAAKGMSIEAQGLQTRDTEWIASSADEGSFQNRFKFSNATGDFIGGNRTSISSYGDLTLDATGLDASFGTLKSTTGSVNVSAKTIQVGGAEAAEDIVANLGTPTTSTGSNGLGDLKAGQDILISVDAGTVVLSGEVLAKRDIAITTPGTSYVLYNVGLAQAGRNMNLGSEGHFVRVMGGNSSGTTVGFPTRILRALDTMSIVSDAPLVNFGSIEAFNGLTLKAWSIGKQYDSAARFDRIIFASNAATTMTSSATFTGAGSDGVSHFQGLLHSAGDLNLTFAGDLVNGGLWTGTSTSGWASGSISSAKALTVNAKNIMNAGGTLYGGTKLVLTATESVQNSEGAYTDASVRHNIPADIISGGDISITAGTRFANNRVTSSELGDASVIADGDITINAPEFANHRNSVIISNGGKIKLIYTTSAYNQGPLSNRPVAGLISGDSIELVSNVAFDNEGVLRATTLTGTGAGGVTNSGSPSTSTIQRTSANAGTPVAGPTTVTGTTPLSDVTPQSVTPGGKLSFGGFTVTLPSKPNGYFVISKNPTSRFLVETNPLYVSGVSLGSDYLMSRYSIDPEKASRRLGDNNYEAYLVRQQLMAQTGANILKGYGDETAQMQRLMDQAYSQGQQAGFVFGQALTPAQIAGLKQDIVWMETLNIGGEPVLVPRVYLAQSTRDMIASGATIMAEEIRMEGSVTNKNGTIESSGKNLSITAGGDITNTRGTIRAGDGNVSLTAGGDITNKDASIRGADVSLTSTGGSIVNETSARDGYVNHDRISTIEASGDLKMDAAKDITVKGANVTASGNAALKAGENITFDTIVETSGSESRESGKTVLTTTTTNIGSNLTVGGNLSLDSGKDTTLAGSDAKVEGSLSVTTGGDFNVISRQDTTNVRTTSSQSGFGVGGGVFGTTRTETNEFTGTNAASTLTVGGDASVKNAGQTVLQGSDVSIQGNARIDADKGIAVLDGLDEQRTTSRTTTTTFLSSETSSGSGSANESQSGTAGRVSSASAGGASQAEAGADFNLMKTTTTVSETTAKTSVGSNLDVGGNLELNTQGTVTVQGSNVTAGQDLSVNAKNVDILTGRNETTSVTTTNSTALGLFTESGADASGSASATAQARGPLGTGVGARAEGSANAEATATLGIKTTSSRDTSSTVTNTSSSLSSGGNMSITATDTATFQGARVSSGGDMSIEAKDIRNLAAQDTTLETSSSNTQLGGIYLGASAGAQGSAQASANASGVNSSGGGEAGVELAVGVRYKNTESNEASGTTTQVTNTFSAGGNLNRKAADTIVDQGTQAQAGGNITQSARGIRDEAVSNTSFSSSDSQSHEARIGMTVEAEVKGSTTSAAESGTGMGGKATYAGEISSEAARDTTAVTSSFKAGGNISSTSTEKTTLVGTQFEAKGDLNLQAGSLEYKAAADTSTSSGTSHSIEAEVSVSADEVGVKGGYGLESANSASSTARVGSIASGGNLTITTQGNASLEGTDLSAGGNAAVQTGGNLEIKAARDTSSSSATSVSVQAEANASRENSDKNGKLAAEGSHESATSDQARVGTITTQGNLTLSSGGNATLVGTQVSTGGAALLQAGGSVQLQSATSSSSEVGLSGGVRAQGAQTEAPAQEGAKKEGEAAAGKPGTTTTRAAQGEFSAGSSSDRTSTGVRIDAGNGLTIQNNVREMRQE